MTHELNPDDNPSIRDAIKEYEDRTLLRATKATPLDVFAPQGILTTLGPVHAITYTGTLQGDPALYEHTFEGQAGPLLVVDETNAIHLVGGEYHVSDLGIEDGEGPSPRANPAVIEWRSLPLVGPEGYPIPPGSVEAQGSGVVVILTPMKPGRTIRAPFQIDAFLYRADPKTGQPTDPGRWLELDEKDLTHARSTWDPTLRGAKQYGERLIRAAEPSPSANPAFSRAPLGEGGRFAACVAKVSRQPGVYDPEGLCASIGRKKYGAKKMAEMAKAGRRNPAQYGQTAERANEAVRGSSRSFPFLHASSALNDLLQWLVTNDPNGVYLDWDLIAEGKDPMTIGEAWAQVAKEAAPVEFEWPPDNLPVLAALAFQSSQEGTRETPRFYHMINLYDADQRPGMKEDHEANLLDLYQREPAQFEVALGSYLGRKYRFLWDAEYRSNPVSSDDYRHREHAATTAEERHHWRRKKGEAMRRGNPVVTNRISPNSPIENAGVLAMAMPGGGPYGLPQVNAGALAAAPDYPGDYDFPGVTNGSHGLLGPQIRRNVPGQPIANPAIKADGKWHRLQASRGPGSGLSYLLDAGDVWAEIGKYQPRKYPTSRSLASDYLDWHGQELPANAPWVAIGYIGSLRQTLRGAPSNPPESVTSHKTLKAAKRAAEKALKGIRAR